MAMVTVGSWHDPPFYENTTHTVRHVSSPLAFFPVPRLWRRLASRCCLYHPLITSLVCFFLSFFCLGRRLIRTWHDQWTLFCVFLFGMVIRTRYTRLQMVDVGAVAMRNSDFEPLWIANRGVGLDDVWHATWLRARCWQPLSTQGWAGHREIECVRAI